MNNNRELDYLMRCKRLEKQLATVTRALADAQEQLDGARALLETYKKRNDAAAHIWTGEDDERG
jgi:multidrug resistance efflux pump